MIGERYDVMFETQRSLGMGAFVPFLVLGDPSPGQSLAMARALVSGGADALELGIPFGDPVADGPTIQRAVGRALAAGTRLGQCFDIVATLRHENPNLPIGLLTYAGTVFGFGPQRFLRATSESGADSVLVADLPIREAASYLDLAKALSVGTVFIAPPGLDQARLSEIAAAGDGFTYVVARAGVTGADEKVKTNCAKLMADLAAAGAPPPMVGFGISTPKHVRDVIGGGAAGAISGSAVVAVHEGAGNFELALDDLTGFARSMKEATLLDGSGGR